MQLSNLDSKTELEMKLETLKAEVYKNYAIATSFDNMSRDFSNKHLLSAKETGEKFIELRNLYYESRKFRTGWQKYITGSFSKELGIKLCMRTVNKYIHIASNWKIIEDLQLVNTTHSNALKAITRTLNKNNPALQLTNNKNKVQSITEDYKAKYEDERKARLEAEDEIKKLRQQLLETKSVTSKWQLASKPISAVNPLIANMPYVTSNSLDQIQKKLFPFQDSYSTSNK